MVKSKIANKKTSAARQPALHKANVGGSTGKNKVFYVKVLQCTNPTYDYSNLVGKIFSVIKDPINNVWYNFEPELPINALCKADGNYSRDGFLYGVMRKDCEVITDLKTEKTLSALWRQFRKELSTKPPTHLTANKLNRLVGIIDGRIKRW